MRTEVAGTFDPEARQADLCAALPPSAVVRLTTNQPDEKMGYSLTWAAHLLR